METSETSNGTTAVTEDDHILATTAEGSKVEAPKDAPKDISGDQIESLQIDSAQKESTKDALASPPTVDTHNATNVDLAHQTIPLLFYTRVRNSALHRSSSGKGKADEAEAPFQTRCTCSVMGRILLSPENLTGPSETTPEEETPPITLLQQHFPHLACSGPDQPVELFVAVMGFADGTVVVSDAKTQGVVCSGLMRIREGGKHHPVVGLSMDSSGSYLAAVDAGGMCTIFEMTKFQIKLPPQESTTDSTPLPNRPSPTSHNSNVFSNFMSAFNGSSQAGASSTSDTISDMGRPQLVVGSLQTQRISYPRNFGAPSSVAIDPAYKRRREKALLVGFADGRLVRTSRGVIFQRRNDSVLHQALPASPADSNMAPGIQSLVWRGGLAAWAEPSGIRLFDADALSKIAHVDRPVGAKPSLYPSVNGMTARLCFETANHLLVAWGDCLLQLTIKETSAAVGAASATAEGAVEGAPLMMRKRTVECTMAWELDCIAVGVVPLDASHIMLLGLLPTNGDENNGGAHNDQQNEVELQVVSRTNGNVVYSDLLPLLTGSDDPKSRKTKNVPVESIAPFALLSTFDVARMENNAEGVVFESSGADFDPASMFTGDFSMRRSFRDCHLQWDVSHVSTASEYPVENNADTSFDDEEFDTNDDDEVSAGSMDSDDYSFIYRPLTVESNTTLTSSPPTVWIVSGSDSVAARVRNLDDIVRAVKDKPALALQRALRRRADLRTHTLDDLVNAYFGAVLRRSEYGSKRLSLRRMKLAASAMPVLIGGNTDLWQYWIEQLKELPGALFILRNVVPVRDPLLHPQSYTSMLQRMFEHILQMKETSQSNKSVERLVGEAQSHFLLTVLGWGTSLGIREHLALFRYLFEMSPVYKSQLIAIEDIAKRRKQQSSAIYLSFPAENLETRQEPNGLDFQGSRGADEIEDALYDIEVLEKFLQSSISHGPVLTNEHGGSVALDAVAKIMISKANYDAALKYFLLLGSRYGSLSLDAVELSALEAVQEIDHKSSANDRFPHAFVLSLIETKHLHQLLLDESLLSEDTAVPPIIALMQLVGVDLAGNFLVKHCVPAQLGLDRLDDNLVKGTRKGERRGTLPIDDVANQLEASPKVLYWYLHCILKGKPEVYVKFPNTANPPEIVTKLHRKALDLYIKYAGSKKDSANVLRGIEAYRAAETDTPLLTFLRAVLQLGGINPMEVAKRLQVERKGGSGISRVFALELAFILDRYGEQSSENAGIILELYLHGANSLVLAVSFAQRSEFRTVLLQTLIDYCLSIDQPKASKNGAGDLFGSLLEAAALCGADLANLVTKIPPGMSIEGLRPRLVAAVSDYRFKRQMHSYASNIATGEAIQMYRECEHRTRRGRRYELSDKIEKPAWVNIKNASGITGEPSASPSTNHSGPVKALRPKTRPERFRAVYSLPLR